MNSREVAQWGDGWLAQWIGTCPLDSNRVRGEATPQRADWENRAWIAQHWRELDLESVMHLWQDQNGAKLDADTLAADLAAGNHLRLYERERDGLLVWRAFREYRARDLALPENILLKLEQWAERLEHASGASDVAEAVEMTSTGGGASGASRLKGLERNRAIVTEVERLRNHANYKPTLGVIYARVGESFGTSASNVKRICSDWRKRTRLLADRHRKDRTAGQ